MAEETIKFDPARPHSEVWGQPGLAFTQDGHTFNGKGELVTEAQAAKLQPVDAPMPQPTPDDGTIPRCITLEESPKSQEEVKETSGLETMHWATLKKMCGMYGIDYENREQAIAALQGR